MSRDYGKIIPQFWTGDTGRSMRGLPHLWAVASYLVSGPHANMIGVYYLPLSYICHDLGLEEADVEEAIDGLVNRGFLVVDAESEWVWVREMARIQIADSLKATDNRVKGVLRELSKAPKPLRGPFTKRYAEAFHLPPEAFEAPSEGSGGGSGPLRSQEQEQEQETRSRAEAGPRAEARRAGAPATATDTPIGLNGQPVNAWRRGDPLTVAGDFAKLAEQSGGRVAAGMTAKASGIAKKILKGGRVPAGEYEAALEELAGQSKTPNTGLLAAVILRRRAEEREAESGEVPLSEEVKAAEKADSRKNAMIEAGYSYDAAGCLIHPDGRKLEDPDGNPLPEGDLVAQDRCPI